MKHVSVGAALAVLALSACMNPYRVNFNSTLDKAPAWMRARLGPPPAGAPRIQKSDDIKADGRSLFEKGYVMIGFARFDGPALDAELALAQGRKVGAEIVLVQDSFTKSLTENVAVTQWAPDERTEIREEGTIGSRRLDRRTEIRTTRSPETVYVPRRTDYYEHAATYWRKMNKPVFGALVDDLSDEQKQRLQSNRGLVVKAIVADSPAFEADILKGDIITRMNGEAVPSAERFYQDLIQQAGKEVTVTLLRGKETLERKATLNP